MHKVSKSIFGSSIDPHYWKAFGKSPKQVVAKICRLPLSASLSKKEQAAASFELLKSMGEAMPQREDAECLRDITLVRESLSFTVPCFQDRTVEPYPRFTVNQDPFWFVQRMRTYPIFPFKEAFEWSRGGKKKAVLDTCSKTITEKIEITLKTEPIASKREENFFEYHVTIRNTGKPGIDPSCQLLSRHWYFLDSNTKKLVEVVGAGVLGELPVLHPGDSHSYTSGTDLESTQGVIKGLFQFARFSVKPATQASKQDLRKAERNALKIESKAQNSSSENVDEKFVDLIDVHIAPTQLRR